MRIQVMNEYCAKIELTDDECALFGIDYDSFSGNDNASRLFIASVLQKLREMEISVCQSDKLTAEVFQRNGGGLIMYLSGKGLKLRGRKGERLIFCDTPAEVIRKLSELPQPESAELYKYSGRYAIISAGSSSDDIAPQYLCEKIKEYGELLSDTPFLKLYGIISPEDL